MKKKGFRYPCVCVCVPVKGTLGSRRTHYNVTDGLRKFSILPLKKKKTGLTITIRGLLTVIAHTTGQQLTIILLLFPPPTPVMKNFLFWIPEP